MNGMDEVKVAFCPRFIYGFCIEDTKSEWAEWYTVLGIAIRSNKSILRRGNWMAFRGAGKKRGRQCGEIYLFGGK